VTSIKLDPGDLEKICIAIRGAGDESNLAIGFHDDHNHLTVHASLTCEELGDIATSINRLSNTLIKIVQDLKDYEREQVKP